MSIQFNDTTNFKGLVQLYEKELGYKRGDVSGNTNLLKEFTADCNLAWDDFLSLAFESSGTWQFDDSNHADFPEITANLVSGQRDYTFTTDETGNLILDIYRVYAKDSASGTFKLLKAVDQQSQSDLQSFYDGNNTTGIPTRYDKTANGFFLDPIPSYNSTGGLKVQINREASYFAYTDTTKKPGCPGDFQAWFYLKPAYEYARRNDLANVSRLDRDVLKYEQKIIERFSQRAKDERPRLTTKNENTR